MAQVSVVPRRRNRPGRRAQLTFVGLGLTPVMLLLMVFSAIPIVGGLILSLYHYNGLDPQRSFVGLLNFKHLFVDDPLFYTTLRNTVIYVAVAVPLNLVLTLPLAMALNKVRRLQGVLRTCFFLPTVLVSVAVALVWLAIYDPSAGLLNNILRTIGLPTFQWLADPSLALPCLIVLSVWQDMGYNTVIFLAGLQGIPEVYYEAARIDGAGRWATFRHVTLPLLQRTTTFVVVLTMISYFQVFVPMQVMTQGGPLDATRTLVLYIYDTAFSYQRLSYGEAMAVVLLIIILFLTLLQLRVLRTKWEY
jgi:ABC-type sugar transport system permease subunit